MTNWVNLRYRYVLLCPSTAHCVHGVVLLCFSETTSGDQATASNCGHSSSSSSSQSLSSAPGALGSTPSNMSSSSSGQVAQSVQSPSPALLQDPALLHQLLPALQATLQMNNGSMDMAKLNEGKEQIRLKFMSFFVLCVIQYNVESTLLVYDCTPRCVPSWWPSYNMSQNDSTIQRDPF